MSDQKNINRLWDAVSSRGEGMTLKNIKFCLGSQRDITQAQIIEQAANNIRAINAGAIKPVETLDTGIAKQSLSSLV